MKCRNPIKSPRQMTTTRQTRRTISASSQKNTSPFCASAGAGDAEISMEDVVPAAAGGKAKALDIEQATIDERNRKKMASGARQQLTLMYTICPNRGRLVGLSTTTSLRMWSDALRFSNGHWCQARAKETGLRSNLPANSRLGSQLRRHVHNTPRPVTSAVPSMEKAPQSRDALRLQARKHAAVRDYDSAISTLSEALTLQPNDAELAVLKEQAICNMNDSKDHKRIVQAFAKKKPQALLCRAYIISATGLTSRDSGGGSDPYLKLRLGRKEINDSKNENPTPSTRVPFNVRISVWTTWRALLQCL